MLWITAPRRHAPATVPLSHAAARYGVLQTTRDVLVAPLLSAALVAALLLPAGCGGAAPPAPAPAPVAVVAVPDAPSSPDVARPVRAPAADPGQRFEVLEASTRYDFRFTVQRECQTPVQSGAACVRLGSIAVARKAVETPLQTLGPREIWVRLDHAGEPLLNAAGKYDWHGTIYVGDFNFDGEEDFAVQDNKDGPDGAPTFAVYLFAAGQFKSAPEMGALTREYSGFFEMNLEKRRLQTHGSKGCCYYERTEYDVVNDQPVLVERHVEDSTNGKYQVVTDERLVAGKWQRTTRKVQLPPSGGRILRGHLDKL